METKKSSSANLENRRGFYFKAGLVISISIALVAFEWRTPDNSGIKLFPPLNYDETEILPPITRTREPEMAKPKVVVHLNIVKDNTEIKNETEIIPTEILPGDTIFEVHETSEIVPDDIPYYGSQIMPSFPGGEDALYYFLKKNLKYPDTAKMNGVTGTVYVTFVVNKEGKVTKAKSEREMGFGLDEEAVRVINLMPDWNPGMQNGKPVSVYFTVPIYFNLIRD